MFILYLAWLLFHQAPPSSSLHALPTSTPRNQSLPTQRSSSPDETSTLLSLAHIRQVKFDMKDQRWPKWWRNDIIDTETVDLRAEEYEEVEVDRVDDTKREARLGGRMGWGWQVWYWVV